MPYSSLKNIGPSAVAALTFFSLTLQTFAAEICPKPWVCELLPLEVTHTHPGIAGGPLSLRVTMVWKNTSEIIRAGYLPATGTFRGNILYFEGLGDSMLNHGPLFSKLSEAGYQVIAFDYMGQGGSSGKMDNTRVEFIPRVGEKIWNRYAKHTDQFPTRTILGWSTGGLAAYIAASERDADQVILIAPGIAPNTVVGAGLYSWPPNRITLESLTRAAPYRSGEPNPHLDPIRPNSPVRVPNFAINLLTQAKSAQNIEIPTKVPGLVLLSGNEDTYVDAEKTRRILKKGAPHFKIIQYENALHEIDNEREETSLRAADDILTFLRANQ